MSNHNHFSIRKAEKKDVATIMNLIRKLAEYEKLSHEVTATDEMLEESLFGEKSVIAAIVGEENGIPVGFALYFYNYTQRINLKY